MTFEGAVPQDWVPERTVGGEEEAESMGSYAEFHCKGEQRNGVVMTR